MQEFDVKGANQLRTVTLLALSVAVAMLVAVYHLSTKLGALDERSKIEAEESHDTSDLKSTREETQTARTTIEALDNRVRVLERSSSALSDEDQLAKQGPDEVDPTPSGD